MQVNELKAEIVRNNMTTEELSDEIGIDRSTLYRRFHNPDSFTLEEIINIKKVLKLDNKRTAEIFFNKKVS